MNFAADTELPAPSPKLPVGDHSLSWPLLFASGERPF